MYSKEEAYSKIAELVERFSFQIEKQQTTIPDKLNHLNTRIRYTDDNIHGLVYDLYRLSKEEIEIVVERF